MTTAAQSRDIAEASREKQWSGQSFIRDLFLGKYRFDLFESLTLTEPARPEFRAFYESMASFLAHKVDPAEIDRQGEYPEHVLQGLRELRAFGMKIPREYGGLGLTHAEYMRVMQLIGSYDGNITALLSAHQAIGVPQPIRLFGTEQQKLRFLPRCARGAISAFALTEPAVGSDPARLGTTCELSADGKHFILNGAKLWCTNGTLAELIVVMARDVDSLRINAFVLEMDTQGVEMKRRCHFMGLHALGNAYLELNDVHVPRENLIGEEGAGLKIALVTLNTGRLSLPAATAGIAKRCTEIVRKWSSARVQWGEPVGHHDAVAQLNADIACSAFAMESVAYAVGELADRKGFDIRLEAAAAKEWNTVRAWRIADETLQVRGGRGYETEWSLANRGEPAIGVERMLRDVRVNMIFEGSSEIMHLFMAREAVDEHLRVAGKLVDRRATLGERLKALPRIIFFYAWWYPSRWFGYGLWPRFSRHGSFAGHLRFADRATRKLARTVFHGMLVYRAGLEKKQAFLFRAVDIAIELFVLSACVRRAEVIAETEPELSLSFQELADLSARRARRRIGELFRGVWRNDDAQCHALARALLEGRYLPLERGIMALPYETQDLAPKTVAELREARARPSAWPAAPMTAALSPDLSPDLSGVSATPKSPNAASDGAHKVGKFGRPS